MASGDGGVDHSDGHKLVGGEPSTDTATSSYGTRRGYGGEQETEKLTERHANGPWEFRSSRMERIDGEAPTTDDMEELDPLAVVAPVSLRWLQTT